MLAALILSQSFLLVVLDDIDYRRFGFAGDPLAVTPVMDDLAARGVLLPNGYVPMAICRPALAALLVGQSPDQTGIATNASEGSLATDGALAAMLQQAGYRTFLGGKYWELNTGDPDAFGFDLWQDASASDGDPTMFGREGQLGFLDFLDSLNDEPFFVLWSPLLPHTPFNAPAEELARVVDANQIPVPPYVSPTEQEVIRVDFGRSLRLTYAEATRLMYANTAWVDTLLGDALDALAERGRLADTTIIICGDNGWVYGGNSKSSPYELGIRTPVIVVGPGIAPQTRPDFVSLLDFAPTIAAYAGVAPHPSWRGGSLRPLLAGGAGPRDWIAGVSYDTRGFPLCVHMRDGDWKMMYFLRASLGGAVGWRYYYWPFPQFDNDETRLFNVATDTEERFNLVNEPENAARAADMRRRALSWYYYEIAAAENPCPSDVTFDGVTDLEDLADMLAVYGQATSAAADQDRDGVVGMSDLAILLAAFGAGCDR